MSLQTTQRTFITQPPSATRRPTSSLSFSSTHLKLIRRALEQVPAYKTRLNGILHSRTCWNLETMGSLAEEIKDHVKDGRKPRILCLHGFRTSGEIMRRQVIGKWPATVTSRLDLIFPDAPWPAAGKSDVEGFFDPPYYEWFQFDKDYMHYVNLDECFEFIEDLMIKHGPIDGLMGFSQGAILSAALAGMQEKGLALTRVPKLKFVVIIGGAKFPSPTVAEKAYSTKISCPSLHFIGAEDFLHSHGKILLESFVDPLVIHHPKGHTVPRLDPKTEEMAMGFIDKIEKTLTSLDAPKDEQEEHPILV